MKRKSIYLYSLLLSVAIGVMPGCKKMIEVDPPINTVSDKEAFKNNANAIAVLNGIYISMSRDLVSFYCIADLSADELTLSNTTDPSLLTIYTNAMLSAQNYPMWTYCYDNIFRLNGAIEGINSSSGITDGVKKQLLGEALFTRSFLYFYLINLYGDIPYVTSTDYKVNRNISKMVVKDVYHTITEDLKTAKSLLSEKFVGNDALSETGERVRPGKWAAAALLARIYLYTEDWNGAKKEADEIIAQSGLFGLPADLNAVFLKNSHEAIWQLAPSNIADGYQRTPESLFFYLIAPPSSETPVTVSNSLYQSFEPDDQRKVVWVGTLTDVNANPAVDYHFVGKYKSRNGNEGKEYSMVLRLAEVYLIRAEARAKLGTINGANGALSDLNALRVRAGLTPIENSSSGEIEGRILQERKVELFSEWVHRWLDMKRTHTVDAIMTAYAPSKGSSWNSTDQLYPIPLKDIQNNPKLNPQNPGYE